MSFDTFMYVKAESGVIKGFSGQEDKTNDGKVTKDLTKVLSVFHQIMASPHPETGEPTGESRHMPIQVTMQMDCSVAELYRAIAEGRRFEEVKLYLFRAGSADRAGGKTEEKLHNWFTISLEKPRIANIVLRHVQGGGMGDMFEVSWTYEKITWEDHDDKKMAEYTWKKKAGK